MGKIVFDDEPDNIPEATYAGVNYVDKVSCKEIIRYNEGEGKKKVVLVDCGVKSNIIMMITAKKHTTAWVKTTIRTKARG